MLKILYNVGFVASFWNIPSETLYVLGARKELNGFQNSWISCFSFNTRKVSAAKYVYRLFTVSKCNSTLLSESTCLSQVCHQLSRYWCATDHKKTKTAQKLTRNSQETTRKRRFKSRQKKLWIGVQLNFIRENLLPFCYFEYTFHIVLVLPFLTLNK